MLKIVFRGAFFSFLIKVSLIFSLMRASHTQWGILILPVLHVNPWFLRQDHGLPILAPFPPLASLTWRYTVCHGSGPCGPCLAAGRSPPVSL